MRDSRGSTLLTRRQRTFVEALARDPTRNATKAAREAGAGRGASVRASKWLRLAKVQDYLTALTAEARTRAEQERLGAVASLQEVMVSLTTIMRAGNMGEYLRLTPNGGIEPDYDAIRRAPPGALKFRQGQKGSWSISLNADRALETLLRYYASNLGRR